MHLVRRSLAVLTAALFVVGALALPAFAKSDKQVAKAASITVADLGKGWKATKHVDDPPSGIAACADTDAANQRSKKYKFQAPDFEQGGSQVTNSVYVFPNVKAAKAYLAAFQDPSALECLQDGLDQKIENAPGASVDVSEFDVTGGPAQDGVGYEVVLRDSVPNQSGTTDPIVIVADIVAFRVGRGVTGLTTQNVDEALPITADLATLSIKRLKKGLK